MQILPPKEFLDSCRGEQRWSRYIFMHTSVELNQMPDVQGHFGEYGGVFVPETLMPAISELRDEYERAQTRSSIQTGVGAVAAIVLWTSDAALLMPSD